MHSNHITSTPEVPIRVGNLGHLFADTDAVTDYDRHAEVKLALDPRTGKVSIHFPFEAVPLADALSVYEFGPWTTVEIALQGCWYNGVWDIPTAAFVALHEAAGRRAT